MIAAPLKGQRALVTGSSRGIGRAIAIALAKAGADIAVTYRENGTAAASLVAELRDQGCDAFACPLETADRSSIKEAAAAVEGRWGALSILVNNAGINKPTDFDQITDEDWDRIMAVNLRGPFAVTQSFWPLLIKGQPASVVHIGSVSGQYGGPRTAHYAASKAGLISLSQVIARFGAKHSIRSNVVAAGLIESEMAAKGMANAAVQTASQNIILGRMGQAAEVADAVVFLSSSNSSYITAQTINVNGGLYF